MIRLERLEKHGYRVVNFMSGNGVQAEKGNFMKIKGKSITDVHKQVFGY